jgi:hypothetical protein
MPSVLVAHAVEVLVAHTAAKDLHVPEKVLSALLRDVGSNDIFGSYTQVAVLGASVGDRAFST